MNAQNYLFKRMLIALMILSIGVISCKKSGGVTGTDDSGTKTEEPQEITSSFESEETSFLPGEIRLIYLNGITLDGEEYDAALGDGLELSLKANPADDQNKSLLFIVPEEAEGDFELIFTLNGQEQKLDFSIKEYIAIEDPEAYTNKFIEDLSNELQVLIDETEEGAFKSRLVAAMDSLVQKKTEISSLTNEDKQLLARIISSHFTTSNSANKAKASFFQDTEFTCPDNLSGKTLNSAAGAGVSLYALSLSGTIATTGWGALVGGITGVISGTTLYVSMKSLKSNLITLWDCKTEYFDRSLSALAEQNPLKQSDQVFVFEHEVERTFYVISEFELPKDIQEALDEVKKYLDAVVDLVPESWAEIIYRDYISEEEDDPMGVAIQSISDSRISGTITAQENQAVINLIYDKDVSLNIEDKMFEIELAKDGYTESLKVEATLEPPLPIAYERPLSVKIDSVVTDTLQADYAAAFSIQNSPSNGTLLLQDEITGAFSYEPKEGFEGSDSFTFSATNSAGSSEIATVSVDIFDEDSNEIPLQLHGFWEHKEEYTDSNGDGYAIEILEITSNSILTHIYESYKECWEGPYNEMDPNNPGDRDGETYTYYSDDAGEKVTLSIEASQLKLELTADPSTYILIPETSRDMDSLYPLCDE